MDVDPNRLDQPGEVAEIATLERPFVARWHRLVSRTNWEKGRIIEEWRTALMNAGAPAAEYADERWGACVGGISAQHVGRLRRVFLRFGTAHENYQGLFWSHFQAALDWDDAEMWLEGAAQNDWSVAQMRRTRSETLGTVASLAGPDESPEANSFDDDHGDYADSDYEGNSGQSFDLPRGESGNAPSDGGEEDAEARADFDADDDAEFNGSFREEGAAIYAGDGDQETISFVQPFEDLGDLPPDFAEAFDAMKLAILRHKSEGWMQISLEDVIASLDALKQLARAPASDHSSA